MELNPRLQMAREDLRIQITDVFPTPGAILIVHPKYEVQFTEDYVKWLSDTLKEMLPRSVHGMVLAENVTHFDVIRPESDDEGYVRGWNDALKAIGELTT
jgi:hypothetical protein